MLCDSVFAITQKFREFLVEAKRGGYASDSPRRVPEHVLGSSGELQYSKGSYLYRDIYFGSEQFSGIEVVYDGNVPAWSMVSSGAILFPADIREVYAFLKNALRNVSVDFPVRGPRIFREGTLTYENQVRGTLERFAGEECILINEIEVYRLGYHGGVIQ